MEKGGQIALKLFPNFKVVDADDSYFYIKNKMGAISASFNFRGEVGRFIVEKFGERSKLFSGKDVVNRIKKYLGEPTSSVGHFIFEVKVPKQEYAEVKNITQFGAYAYLDSTIAKLNKIQDWLGNSFIRYLWQNLYKYENKLSGLGKEGIKKEYDWFLKNQFPQDIVKHIGQSIKNKKLDNILKKYQKLNKELEKSNREMDKRINESQKKRKKAKKGLDKLLGTSEKKKFARIINYPVKWWCDSDYDNYEKWKKDKSWRPAYLKNK